jgi:multiple antibiotic resistance protein
MTVAFLLTTFSAIFFVVDPFAAVPIFLAMTPRESDAQRADMAKRAALVAGTVLVVFAVSGQIIFHLFGLTLPAFKIAGGLLLLLTALDQLKSNRPSTRSSAPEIAEGAAKEDVAIVPLGIPVLAGPGSIATVMVLSSEAKGWQTLAILVCIAVTAALSWVVLRAAGSVDRFLGATGRSVLLRIAGLLLSAIAVQFILSGLSDAFPHWLAK